MSEAGTSRTNGGDSDDALDWNFLQCFGERTPGEEVQEGTTALLLASIVGVYCHRAFLLRESAPGQACTNHTLFYHYSPWVTAAGVWSVHLSYDGDY
jgi:hypothetical protein